MTDECCITCTNFKGMLNSPKKSGSEEFSIL